MNKIICKIDLFDQQQYIFLASDGEAPKVVGTTNIDNVGSMIAGLCYNKNIYNASIFGNEEYVSKVVHDIEDSAATMFNNGQKIEIEVNR